MKLCLTKLEKERGKRKIVKKKDIIAPKRGNIRLSTFNASKQNHFDCAEEIYCVG